MIARSRWPRRRLSLAVAIVLVTCRAAFAIQYNPIENHGETECALLLDGPGRSSQLDYNLNTLRGTFGYRGSNTCITYDAVNQAYINARKRIQVAQPQGFWEAPDVATVGELLLDITIQLAKTYGLTYEDVEKGLPLIDTSKTLIREVCPPYLANVECRPGKYRRYDGLCTNLQHPTWGATQTPFTRLVGPLFADGMTAPRISVTGNQLPLSRVVSRTMHPDEGFHDHAGTVMIVAWGQFMDHDYTLTATPLDPLNKNEPEECCNRPPHLKNPYCMEIPIPEDDYFYRLTDVRCMDFVRAFPAVRPGCRLGSRIPYNTLTGVLDGNTVYGVTEKFARHLRSGYGGLLRMNPAFNEYGLKDLLPLKLDIPDEGCTRPNRSMFCFEAGEIRVNEQLILTCMHTLMAREHNRVAKGLAQVNPHWDDETLYQEARRIVIAEIQHITYNEFLPILLGKEVMEKFGLLTQKEGYWDGYDPEVNPSVIDAFAAAAFRFGHSLLPTAVERWSKAHKFIASRRLSDLIRRPYDLYRAGVMDEYFMGLMNQVAQAMDDSVTQEVTNHLFKKPGKRFGMDLASFNMQRGREFGLPGYMEFRKFCGLPGAENFDELLGSMPNTTIKRYASIYENPSDVDLWSGGVSERPLPGSMVGPTFACIIATQFSYSRRGDRFWYELGNQPSSFTPEQLAEIRKVKLSRVICDNTDLIDTIQVYPLVLPDHEINPRVPCKSGILPSIDLSKWADYSGGHRGAGVAQSGNIPFDLDPEKPSRNIVTFFAAVSPSEKLETPPVISANYTHAIGMTEAVIIADRTSPNSTEVPDNQTGYTRLKRHGLVRVKRSDEDLDEDHAINPDDDNEDGLIDIDDDAPYEFIPAPDDNEDITVDPNDVAEQTEDAGEHDDDDTNAMVDVSDELDPDDPTVFHQALPPIKAISVHKKAKHKVHKKKTRYTNTPKERVQLKVRQTDHRTVTKPKAKHSQNRHQNKYNINWAGRQKRPNYEPSSQKPFSSHPSSGQFHSPQTLHGFIVKGNPVSDEDVEHHKKIRTYDKARKDIRHSRTTPTIREKETSELALDESYKSRGMSPPRWSSSFIRFEEPESPLLSSGFSDHHPTDPADDHPVSFPNEEITEPTNSALGFPFASATRPAVSTTTTYDPDQNFPEKEDVKMKRITDEIDKILREEFNFRHTFSPPRQVRPTYRGQLPSKQDDRENHSEGQEKGEKGVETVDDRQERPNNQENQEETQRDESEDAGDTEGASPKRHEDAPTPKDEEKAKGEELKDSDGEASVEQQGEAPPQNGDRNNGNESENETTTTESNGVAGVEHTTKTERENNNSQVEKDPRTNRGPVRFQASDSDPPEKKKMKCIPVSEEENVTERDNIVREGYEKENVDVEEIKGNAVDVKEKERVQEVDDKTEDPKTTAKQEEGPDKGEEENSNNEDAPQQDSESERKEEEGPKEGLESGRGVKHDEESQSKNDEIVGQEKGPNSDERSERKETSTKSSPRDDKSNTEREEAENGALRESELKREKEKSNIENTPRKLKVKPAKEEKNEYFIEEYKEKGGQDYQDFQSHRHKETDKQQHNHHGNEEGGHDHTEQELTRSKQDQGSKLKAENRGNGNEFLQHLGHQQSQLQNEAETTQGKYGEQYLTSDKEQDHLKKRDDNKHKKNKGHRQSGRHLGASSFDKIPIIEIFDSVPNVDYSKSADELQQPPIVTSTAHETPNAPRVFSMPPNPNQLREESPITSHFSVNSSPHQRRQELPNSTPLEGLLSKVPNHLSITTTSPITTPHEHLLTTPTPHDHLAVVSIPYSLHTTVTPNDHLEATTPNHPTTSIPYEVPTVFSQDDRVATTPESMQSTASESENIRTTAASNKIIGQLDKEKSDQHNELQKQREDADHQLDKQKKQLNKDLEELNSANSVSPETSATDKRNKQLFNMQDYQQQLFYLKPSPKPQGYPPFITVDSGKRRPPILVEDVDYRELMDMRYQRTVYGDQDY